MSDVPQQRKKQPWTPIPDSSQELALDTRANVTLYTGARGPGKDLALHEKVLTHRGWIEAGYVRSDDWLVTPTGEWTRIVGIFPQPYETKYRVTFDDGCSVLVGAPHRWTVRDSKQSNGGGWVVRTTGELMTLKGRYGVPYTAPCPGKPWRGVDPYIVGYMLANGTTCSDRLCAYGIDADIHAYFKAAGWSNYNNPEWTCSRSVCPVGIEGPYRAILPRLTAEFKSVPIELMTSEPAARLAVLQGLMDGDGSIERTGNKLRYNSLSKQLAMDVAELFRSLGGKATCYYEERVSPRGGNDYRWRVNANARNIFLPFRCARKLTRVEEGSRVQQTRYIESIKPEGWAYGVCFAVEHASHMFVVQNYIVTHNTDTQLMRFYRRVGMGYGAFWRGIIFDREYKNLDDLVSKSKRWFYGFDDGAKFLSSSADYKWVWPTGEELLFRQIKKSDDYWNYHGQEFPFIGWNELCKYPTAEFFDALMSCNRSSFTVAKDATHLPPGYVLPEIPLEVFATANPYGPGHSWVKRRFVDPAPYGSVVRRVTNVFNPKTKERQDITKTQVCIFGSYRENIYLSPEYIAELENIKDVNKRKAWLEGRWDIVAGGAIDDVWEPSIHVVNDFYVPSNWRVDRSFDWGSTHPAACLWWAEADGTEVTMQDGRKWCPPRGTLVGIHELYTHNPKTDNEGLKWSATKVAENIRDHEMALLAYQRIEKQPWPGPADNQIRNVSNSEQDTIETLMGKVGVRWTESDKSKGSRAIGLELIRTRLQAARDWHTTGDSKGPGLFFAKSCTMAIATIPMLPRDPDNPDDVDTDGEDHLYDCTRYRVLAGSNRYAAAIKVSFPS